MKMAPAHVVLGKREERCDYHNHGLYPMATEHAAMGAFGGRY